MGITERKEREKELRREAILNAAQKVFFEKGLASSTVDEIAELAELSKGTIYLYYKSKEDMYLAVILRGEAIMYEMFKKAASTGESTIRQILNVGEAYYAFFKEQRNYFRMFSFFETPQFHKQVSEEMLQQCIVADEKTWTLIAELIAKGGREGVLQSHIKPKQFGLIVWATATGLYRQMDTNADYWEKIMGVDLEATLRLSYSLLLESMMTERAKEEYRSLIAKP